MVLFLSFPFNTQLVLVCLEVVAMGCAQGGEGKGGGIAWMSDTYNALCKGMAFFRIIRVNRFKRCKKH